MCVCVCVCCLYFYLTQQEIQKQYFNSGTHYSSHKDTHDFQNQFYTHGPSKMINVFTK